VYACMRVCVRKMAMAIVIVMRSVWSVSLSGQKEVAEKQGVNN